MDQVSAGEAKRDGARTRRRHMRERARSQHAAGPVSDRYQTPEWLDRSFVLPLTRPETSEVPSQPVRHHDDVQHVTRGLMTEHDTRAAGRPTHRRDVSFVRPPSDDVDFARMIRRADLCRNVGRVSSATAGLAGLALIAYLLVSSVAALAVVVVCTLACLVSMATLVGLTRAPVARLQR